MPNEPAPLAVPLYERPEVHDRRWFLLAILCLSLVMVVMAVSGLNTALPRIQEDLGASSTQLQWILDAYALVFAGLLLPAGAIGDRFGRKGALLTGLMVFGAGSLVSGLASSTAQVIVGRAVSGGGAALLMPATLSLIVAVFPPEERTRAIAVWVGFAGAGGAIGPVVSGVLLNHFWWGSVFLANLPVVAIAAVAIAIYSPRSRDDAATPLDPRGAVLSLVGIAALLFGIIEGPERGWTDVVVVATFVVAVVFIVGFGLWERRAPHPTLPMSFFADRRFSVGSAVVMTTFGLLFGFFFSFTLYLQFARSYSPLDAGLASLPSAVALVLVSSRSAGIVAHLGSGRAMALGFVLIGIGMVIFTQVGLDTPFLVLVLGMVIFSSGAAVAMAPATGNIMSAVPPAKTGVGSAVNDTTRELGGALGIAIFGSIVKHDVLGYQALALPELAEAASRTGDDAVLEQARAWMSVRARATPTAWARGIDARVRALTTAGTAAEGHYRESVAHLKTTSLRVELARGHLLYGEWLRREGRRGDARDELRRAHDMFEGMAVAAFAERARRELLATGERIRKRTAAATGSLTAQEAQIARLVQQGLSNPEVGTRLFLSARTVEWHLRNVFGKVGVSSRRQLRDIDLDRHIVDLPA